ncbi:MAG: YceI family protein [Planctomycetes bacterium]|nr:YceI family protein [Planctomycetota bacterium]
MWKYGILGVLVAVWGGGCSTRLHHTQSVDSAVRPAGGQPSPPVAGGASVASKRMVSLSAENTHVTFIGSAGSTSHEGAFDRLSGQWELPTEDPKDSRLAVKIEIESLRTRIPLLTLHLKRGDFLDAKQFPIATFESTRIEPEPGTNGTTHRVSGAFTIHGGTQTVTFPARVVIGPDAAAFEATFPISQTAFGMAAGAEKAKDEVPVTVVVNARRQ